MTQQEGNVRYHTTRDIYKGEELFVDYGDNYWKSRYIKGNVKNLQITDKIEENKSNILNIFNIL